MAIVKVMAGDPIVNRIQDNVRDTVNPLVVDNAAMKTRAADIETAAAALKTQVDGEPILGGKLLVGQVLASGDNTITHGLGATPAGWMVVMRTTGAVIYDKQAANPSPSTTLVLNSSASCTVTLYVF